MNWASPNGQEKDLMDRTKTSRIRNQKRRILGVSLGQLTNEKLRGKKATFVKPKID